VTVFLVGGGPETTSPGLLDRFFVEVRAVAERSGTRPHAAVVALNDRGRGRWRFPAYQRALAADDVGLSPMYFRRGDELEPRAMAGAHGIVVAGGPTPVYREALVGAGLGTTLPYVGFSAGAMIAASTALIGGCRLAGRVVCPEESSEDLDDLAVRPGLGLVGFAVDVHTSEAGTLGRTVAVVESGLSSVAVGIDEGTCLAVAHRQQQPEAAVVLGRGSVWIVRRTEDGELRVARRTAD
jgi:cyanophycinase